MGPALFAHCIRCYCPVCSLYPLLLPCLLIVSAAAVLFAHCIRCCSPVCSLYPLLQSCLLIASASISSAKTVRSPSCLRFASKGNPEKKFQIKSLFALMNYLLRERGREREMERERE